MFDQLHAQIRRLEQERQRQRSTVPNQDWYSFRVTPTCPPSTSVSMRGGLAYAAPSTFGEDYEYMAWYVPDITCDLATIDQGAWGWSLTWANAGYYRGYMVFLNIPDDPESPTASDWTLALLGSDSEFETPIEAEADLEWYMQYWGTAEYYGEGSRWPGLGMKLAGVILRNDGVTAGEGNILPIDAVNRGRSYLWLDLRHRRETEAY